MADRSIAKLSCPGSRNNLTVIVGNPQLVPWGVGRPKNTGNCTLFLAAIDGSGNALHPEQDLQLNPGDQFDWYQPPAGAAQIVAVCTKDCAAGTGPTILEYDTPNC
jgi:hypothetical protein